MERHEPELANPEKLEDDIPTPEEVHAKDVYCGLFEGEPRYRSVRDTETTAVLNMTMVIGERFSQAENTDPEALARAFRSARNGNLSNLFEQADVGEEHREVATPEVMIGTLAFAADKLEGTPDDINEQMKLHAITIQNGKKIRDADDLTANALEIVKREYHYPDHNKRMSDLMPGIRSYAASTLKKEAGANFLDEAEIAQKSEALLTEVGASSNIVEQWAQADRASLKKLIDIDDLPSEEREEWTRKVQEGESRYVSIRMTRRIVDAIASGELDYAALQRFYSKHKTYQEAQRAESIKDSFEEIEMEFLPPHEGEGEGTTRVVIGGNGETFNNLEVARLLPLADIQNRLIEHGYASNDIRFVQSKLDDKTRHTYEGAGEIAPVYYGIVAKSRDAEDEPHESIFVVNPRGGQRNAAYVVNGEAFGGLDWQDILDNSKPEARNKGAISLKHVGDIAERAISFMTDAEAYEREWMARESEKRRRMRRVGKSVIKSASQSPITDETWFNN